MVQKKFNENYNKRLLLILSPERSGSTLLSVILGSHGYIVAPPEMHLLAYPDFDSWCQGYPSAIESLRYLMTYLGLPNSKKIIEKQFAGWYTEKIYYWLFEHLNKSSLLLVDKTPLYSRELSTLQRAESFKPFFIWLIRHPLGVAASQISLQLKKRQRMNKSLVKKLKYPAFLIESRLGRRKEALRQVEYWVDVNKKIEIFLKGIPKSRYYIVYFEELVHDPKNVINNICKVLGLEFEPAMIDPKNNITPSLKWGLGDEKILTHKTIDASVAHSWHQFISEYILDNNTRELMERLGVVKA